MTLLAQQQRMELSPGRLGRSPRWRPLPSLFLWCPGRHWVWSQERIQGQTRHNSVSGASGKIFVKSHISGYESRWAQGRAIHPTFGVSHFYWHLSAVVGRWNIHYLGRDFLGSRVSCIFSLTWLGSLVFFFVSGLSGLIWLLLAVFGVLPG